MTTNIIAKFKASIVEGMGVIYYQVAHNQIVREIKSDYLLYAHEWCDQGNYVVIDESSPERAKQLRLIRDKISFDIRKLHILAKKLNIDGAMHHCDYLVFEYQRQPKAPTFFNYLNLQVSLLEKGGKSSTSLNYLAAFNSFFKFRDGEDLLLDSITSTLIEEYESYLKRERVSMNSISFYMRNLRAVYNKAAKEGLVEPQNHFKRVYTGVGQTIKRALTLDDIKRIKSYNRIKNPTCDYARDMFLFSFYTRGMSFVDMAYLCKSSINNGVLSYQKRHKGQMLHIKWEQCMQDIVDKYHVEGSIYLLPIINDIVNKPNQHIRYKSELCKVNNWLKKISEDIGFEAILTMNVARNSWALAARAKSIPISVISESLGYNSNDTTQLYLESLDSSFIHGANNSILEEVI